jgi:hypothetical protein
MVAERAADLIGGKTAPATEQAAAA